MCREIFQMNGKEQRNIANTLVSEISTFPYLVHLFFKIKHSRLNRHPLLCFSRSYSLSPSLPRGGHCQVVCIFLAHVFILLYICSLCNIHIVLLIFMHYQKWHCRTILIVFRFSSALYFRNPSTGHTSLVHSCSLHRMRILIAWSDTVYLPIFLSIDMGLFDFYVFCIMLPSPNTICIWAFCKVYIGRGSWVTYILIFSIYYQICFSEAIWELLFPRHRSSFR